MMLSNLYWYPCCKLHCWSVAMRPVCKPNQAQSVDRGFYYGTVVDPASGTLVKTLWQTMWQTLWQTLWQFAKVLSSGKTTTLDDDVD
jgi:hypothetical protein